jgi:hypothetical protein
MRPLGQRVVPKNGNNKDLPANAFANGGFDDIESGQQPTNVLQ